MKLGFENKGFLPDVFLAEDYVFGASNVPKLVLRPNADWSDLVDKEIQNANFETYNCTSFNTLSSVEKMIFVITGETVNYSDRWLGIVAGTKPPGNSPHIVAEAIRKHGLIPEEMLPFSKDLQNVDEYYSFKGADEKACREAGKKWLDKFEFFHEWVFTPGTSLEVRIKNMKESLTLCPPSISVTAWYKENGVYVDKSLSNNHWTNYVHFLNNNFWVVNDSYEEESSTIKHLAWDHSILFCKRYHIALKKPTFTVSSNIPLFLRRLAELLGILKKNNIPIVIPPSVVPKPLPPTNEWTDNAKLLYYTAKGCLGLDLVDHNIAPPHLSCALQLNAVYKKTFGREIGGGASTARMYKILESDSRFHRVDGYEVGAIIISPQILNDDGTVKVQGHAGICGKTHIISNNSLTGKIDTFYQLDSWKKYYEGVLKLQTFFYRVL